MGAIGEFFLTTFLVDPDYAKIGKFAANVCQAVDPSYTDHFLASDQEAKQPPTVG